MKSLLRDLPEGANVILRSAHEGVVETVWGGRDRLLFEARVGIATSTYDSSLIAEADRPLLAKGARFWLIEERVELAGGTVEDWRGIRFERPGVATSAQVLADRTAAR